MAWNRRTICSAVLVTAATTGALGQGRGEPCTLGYELSYGISAIDCLQCTIRSDGNEHWAEYGAEPVVRAMFRMMTPIQPGDVLVAIDGKLITTAAGGRALAHPVAGQAARFTVRRAGKQIDVNTMPGTPCPIVSTATAALLASSVARADSMNRAMTPAAKDSLHQRMIESMARMNALPDTFELRYERDAFGRPYHVTFMGDSAKFGTIGTGQMLYEPDGRGLFMTDNTGARKFRELNRGGGSRWKFMRADTLPDGTVRSIWNGGRDTNFALRAGRGVGGGAVHTIPDPYYITSSADSSVTGKSVRFLNVPSNGIVRVFTSDGLLVRVLQNTAKEAGAAVSWDGRNRSNQFVGSGIYFYTVETSGVPTSSGRLTIVNATGHDPSYWTFTQGDSGTGYKFGRGTRVQIDSVSNGRLHGNIDFSPDAAPYQAMIKEYLLLGSSTARGWLGFGIECHDCSFVVDSAKTRIWRFPTYPTIAAVDRAGPAESAGILAGDLLRAIDGTLVTTPGGATRFSMLKAGDRVRVTVERSGKAIDLTLIVAKVN